MLTLESISQISRVYDTYGSRPVLVQCSDIEFYVCKYNTSFGSSANKLFREYIAACFLKEWNLSVPDFAFVKILEEHIGEFSQLQPIFLRPGVLGQNLTEITKRLINFIHLLNQKIEKHLQKKMII